MPASLSVKVWAAIFVQSAQAGAARPWARRRARPWARRGTRCGGKLPCFTDLLLLAACRRETAVDDKRSGTADPESRGGRGGRKRRPGCQVRCEGLRGQAAALGPRSAALLLALPVCPRAPSPYCAAPDPRDQRDWPAGRPGPTPKTWAVLKLDAVGIRREASSLRTALIFSVLTGRGA